MNWRQKRKIADRTDGAQHGQYFGRQKTREGERVDNYWIHDCGLKTMLEEVCLICRLFGSCPGSSSSKNHVGPVGTDTDLESVFNALKNILCKQKISFGSFQNRSKYYKVSKLYDFIKVILRLTQKYSFNINWLKVSLIKKIPHTGDTNSLNWCG